MADPEHATGATAVPVLDDVDVELNGRPMNDETSPLLDAKVYDEPSVFEPENLLREARRQRHRPDITVPAVCLLDPDGDIVTHLTSIGTATIHRGWACFHTTLHTFELAGTQVGVVGCAVGSSFAVLVAEQLAASGCDLLISVTSSGSIIPTEVPPYFVLIERALRDEGTSLHYLPPSTWAAGRRDLLDQLGGEFGEVGQPVVMGSSWTTDAPYRETRAAIARAEELGIAAVEMEAAALYAYAAARDRRVICVAHVTNTMATGGDDFEKGDSHGAHDALALVGAMVNRLISSQDSSSV